MAVSYTHLDVYKRQVVVLDGKSPAAQGYQNIAKRLLGERVPIMQITHKPTFTEKFKNLFAK